MAQIVQEELWTPADMHVITTNALVKRNGNLVMGRGAAKEAMARWPKLPGAAGKAIKATCGSQGVYGLLTFKHEETGELVGLFQVKLHWKQNADLELIKTSVEKLRIYAEKHDSYQIRMNYPGIGNGRLNRAVVEPLLNGLPDNVTICYR